MNSAEAKLLKTASRLILDQIAEDGVVKIPGFGRFEVKEISYRNPTTGDKEHTRTLRFYPFSGAKLIAKHGKTSWVKTTKRDHSKPLAEKKRPAKETARPMAKVTPPEKKGEHLTPGVTYEGSVEAPKPSAPPPPPRGFSFSFGGPKNNPPPKSSKD